MMRRQSSSDGRVRNKMYSCVYIKGEENNIRTVLTSNGEQNINVSIMMKVF